MKKLIIGLLLMLALALTLSCAYAEESEMKVLESQVVNNSGYSAKEWFETEETRSMLTVLLAAEHYLKERDSGIIMALSGRTYVGLTAEKNALILIYYFYGMEYYMTYQPEQGKVSYSGPVEATIGDVVRTLENKDMICEYHLNTQEMVNEMLTRIKNALMEEN